MAGAERKITVSLLANDGQFTPQMKRAAQITEQFAADLAKLDRLKLDAKELKVTADIKDAERELNKLGSQSSEMFKRRANEIGDSLTNIGKKATVGLTLPIVAGLGKAVEASNNLGESIDFTNKLFTTSADAIHNFGKQAVENYGLSQRAVEQYSQSFAGLLKTGVHSQQELADKSIELTKRASDLGSALNKSSDEVAAALRSGLAGETEPLRALNIVISEADVKTRAYALGLAKAGTEVSEAAKVQARYSLIMDQSKIAAGNFADTVGNSLVNQQKKAGAAVENAAVSFGDKLKPAVMAAEKAVGTLATGFGNLSSGSQQVIVFGAAAVAAFGPIATAAGGVVKAVGGIKGAIDGMRTAQGTLTATGKALAGLSVASAVVGGILAVKTVLDGIDKAHYEKNLQRVTDAMSGVGEAFNAQELKKFADAMNGTGVVAKNVGDEVSRVIKGMVAANNIPGAQKFVDQLDAAGLAPARVAKLRGEIDLLIERYRASGKAAADSAAILDGSTGTFKDAADATYKAGQATQTLTNSTGVLTKWLGETARSQRDSAVAAKEATKALLSEQSATELAAKAKANALQKRVDDMNKAQEEESIQRGIASAIQARADQQVDAARAVADAQKALNDTRQKQIDLAKNVEAAEKGVTDSKLDLYNATQDQAAAEKALNDVYNDQPPKIEDIQRAEEDLENARKARKGAEKQAQNATEALSNAQDDLADLQANAGTKAEKALAKARRDSESASRNVAKAERELQELLAKGGATQEEVKDAEDRIADARDRVTDATERVTEAEKKLAGVGDEIAKAQENVTEKTDALTEANDDLVKKTDAVNAAEKKLMDEREGRKASQDDINKKVDELNAAMGRVADKTQAVKDKEKELSDARQSQKQGFTDIANAETALKDTTLKNEQARKTAVEGVTAAYQAQTRFLLGQEVAAALENAQNIAAAYDNAGKSLGKSTQGTGPADAETRRENAKATGPALSNGTFGDSLATSANVRAFLDALAAAEGTANKGANGYNVQVGGKLVGTGASKPRQVVDLGNGLKSSAAGRYQFLNSTWDALAKQLGLVDFSAESQDKAAIELIRSSGALDLIEQGKFSEAFTKVRKVWASLPGAGYGQGERSLQFLMDAVNRSLATQGAKRAASSSASPKKPPVVRKGGVSGGAGVGGIGAKQRQITGFAGIQGYTTVDDGGGNMVTVRGVDPEDIADEIDGLTGERIEDGTRSALTSAQKQQLILNKLRDQGFDDAEASKELLRLTMLFSGDLDQIANLLGAQSDEGDVTEFDKAVSRFAVAVEAFANSGGGSNGGGGQQVTQLVPSPASAFDPASGQSAASRAAAAAKLAGQSANPPEPTTVTPIQLTTTSGTPITVDPVTGERRPVSNGVNISVGAINVAPGATVDTAVASFKNMLYDNGLVRADGVIALR